MIINKSYVLEDVTRALAEDVGTGDISAALLSPLLIVNADIISREPMLVCGIPWVIAVFAKINPEITINWYVQEGAWLNEPSILCQITGPATDILTAERTALNFLQTLSATATQTRQYLLKLQGTTTKLLDTRKTIPGLRRAQKYAVACAGGENHRMGLYDAFLIKENHIKSCGSITKAIALAREKQPGFFVEVEVETLSEFEEALAALPDRILLDNFSNAMLEKAVIMNQRRCQLEASGGIDLSNISAVAATGVDYISVGSITKSIQAIDLSLLVREVK
ncbi:carboxylating nicotinate-nucleotide diphosphorylase [Legionella hackeliae]|uniref:nicotinate-nucleotide diphosphorylase (carboxylating) n=1 Tax=Legionella hackeliae TaxID=449 RepID=A0A0A8UN27_LEGHA|nr:carboxylating nicotinate-nucleotide diphosphorylase [Legionella hackeliae]KTD08857.1 nicotinate-nucleotide pyrophosphorylase [Legionella hackeliae]CEK10285.1 Nicotinate-nucleotide pyrophosphorylase [carboxylating] [Legionella hackeliae]STX47015.1 nicotinate-nucleotide pyrophosphorylase [Legionella hackeliae]